jgi:pSer/pThr/pTyr-binding forkhead associated (FHA) protein
MPRLEYESPTKGLITVALGAAPVRVGRRPDCELVLESPFSARLHFQVQPRAGGGYEIMDTGSAGGTYVNQQRVTITPLKDGDVIRIGSDVTVLYRE